MTKKEKIKLENIRYFGLHREPLYEGEVVNGKPHGHGKLTFEKCDDKYESSFEGLFEDGIPIEGKFFDKEGTIFDGKFEKISSEDGNGRIIYKNGDEYVGEWSNLEKWGQGTFISNNGIEFKGEWAGDCPLDGVMTFPDGTRFRGNFNEYTYEFANGEILYPDGSKFESEFADVWSENYSEKKDVFEGTFTYPNGKIVEGTLHIALDWDLPISPSKKDRFEPNKKGIITYKDLKFEGSRSFYEGETIDGKRHGKGIMYYGARHYWRDIVFEKFDDMKSKYEIDKNKTYRENWDDASSSVKGNINFSYRKSSLEDEVYMWEIYNGEWKEDIIHGHGTFFIDDGSKFVGESKDGSFYKGTLTHPDPYNEKFIGTFKDNDYGEGILTFNGRQYEGTFKDGYFHKGKLTFTDGRIFTGEFNSGCIVKGTMMFNDGSKYVGEFGHNMFALKDDPLGNGRENFTEDYIIEGLGILTKADGSKQKGFFLMANLKKN